MENQNLGALFKSDEVHLNSQVQVQSGSDPVTLCNSDRENQEANNDFSQYNPHPQLTTSVNQSPQFRNSDIDERSFNSFRKV